MAAGDGVPSGPVIEVTGSGAQYSPSAAIVAYASARSSGLVSETPSVNAPHVAAECAAIAASDGARNVMPSRWAIATARAAPTFCSSQTKYVLTDRPKPVHIVR